MFREPNKQLTNFGEILEKRRTRWGMQKTTLCRRVGISVALYNYIIHGARKCTPSVEKSLTEELELESGKE